MTQEHIDSAKHLIDIASISTMLGALAGLLPSIAALLTIVWTALRIYEMKTIQALLKKRRTK